MSVSARSAGGFCYSEKIWNVLLYLILFLICIRVGPFVDEEPIRYYILPRLKMSMKEFHLPSEKWYGTTIT